MAQMVEMGRSWKIQIWWFKICHKVLRDGWHTPALIVCLWIDSINSVFLDHFSSKYTVVMSVQCNPPLQRHYAPAYATQRQSIHSTVSYQYGIVKTDLLVRVIAVHSPRVTKMYHLHVSGMCQLLCGYHDLLLIFFKHTKNDEKQKSKKHVLKCFKYIYIRSVTQCNLQNLQVPKSGDGTPAMLRPRFAWGAEQRGAAPAGTAALLSHDAEANLSETEWTSWNPRVSHESHESENAGIYIYTYCRYFRLCTSHQKSESFPLRFCPAGPRTSELSKNMLRLAPGAVQWHRTGSVEGLRWPVAALRHQSANVTGVNSSRTSSETW